MDVQWNEFLVRWLHIVAAAVAIGGATYTIFVTRRVLPMVPEPAAEEFREAVRRRYARLFMLAVAVLLITGFYNYVYVKMGEHARQGGYHMILGIKILLAFGVFIIGSALTGRASVFEPIRRKAAMWQMINLLMGIAIVGLAGLARTFPVAH